MMEKIKNAMKNGLVKGSCDSFGATSVGSSSERSRSGSDEARTATGRAGRRRGRPAGFGTGAHLLEQGRARIIRKTARAELWRRRGPDVPRLLAAIAAKIWG